MTNPCQSCEELQTRLAMRTRSYHAELAKGYAIITGLVCYMLLWIPLSAWQAIMAGILGILSTILFGIRGWQAWFRRID